MKNQRLINCIAGFAITRYDRKTETLDIYNAENLIAWLKQCKFKIIDNELRSTQRQDRTKAL